MTTALILLVRARSHYAPLARAVMTGCFPCPNCAWPGPHEDDSDFEEGELLPVFYCAACFTFIPAKEVKP